MTALVGLSRKITIKMTRRLKIDADFQTEEETIYFLEEVKRMIQEGFTTGQDWSCWEDSNESRMDDDSGNHDRLDSRFDPPEPNYRGD